MQLHKWLIALLGTVVFMIGSVVPIMGAEESDPTKEQFIPMPTYLTGPFAAGGSGNSGGTIDYFNLLNMRDGGINGIKLTWEVCDFGYNTERGVECYERLKGKGLKGAPMVHPFSTGVTYALLERTSVDKIPMMMIGYGDTRTTDGSVFPYAFPVVTNYWNQSTAKLKFIAQREGGMD